MASLLEKAETENMLGENRLYSRFRTSRCSDVCSSLDLEEVQKAKFFCGRSQAFIKTCIDFFQLETFMTGEKIMKEGEEGDKLVFLHKGKVDVLIGPKEVNVATLGGGSLFGEMALLGSPKRTATIRAAEFCDCRVIDKHTFHRLLRKFPEERAYFEQMATERMEQLEKVKDDNPGARRRLSLPTLHAEGKQRLRKKVLPPLAQAAADKFLGKRRRSTGAISEIAPRIHTDPCLYTTDTADSDEDTSPSRLNQIAEKAVAKFLALRRGSNSTETAKAPRIHTAPTLPCCDEESEENSSDEEEIQPMPSPPESKEQDFISLRRRSAPGTIESKALAAPWTHLASLEDFDAHVGVEATPTLEKVPDCTGYIREPEGRKSTSFRSKLIQRSLGLPPLAGELSKSTAKGVNHKLLLYNVVACQS